MGFRSFLDALRAGKPHPLPSVRRTSAIPAELAWLNVRDGDILVYRSDVPVSDETLVALEQVRCLLEGHARSIGVIALEPGRSMSMLTESELNALGYTKVRSPV